MYSAGEYVVHPGQGVCEVVEEPTDSSPVYRLKPLLSSRPLIISFPREFEDRLRPVLSSSDAQKIIEAYPKLDVLAEPDKTKTLAEEYFHKLIKQGSCEDLLRIVKTFRKEIFVTRLNNKKPPVFYERILKSSRERAFSELAVALHLSQEKVSDTIDASAEGEPELQSLSRQNDCLEAAAADR